MPRAISGWLHVAAAGTVVVACSAEKPPVVVVPPPATPRDAGVVALVERPPVPRATVRQGLFAPGGDGNYLGTPPVAPSPAELALPCYAKLLESDPTFAGWMWISLQVAGEQPPKVALLEHSAETQQKLWPCVIGALSRARLPMPGPTAVDLYLTFAPE